MKRAPTRSRPTARHRTPNRPARDPRARIPRGRRFRGTLLDRPIQYYATANRGGFVRVIDALGGVDVNVARNFCDSHYSEFGHENGFPITAGRHHLNGQQALAYARVRKPAGESDFSRAARLQESCPGSGTRS